MTTTEALLDVLVKREGPTEAKRLLAEAIDRQSRWLVWPLDPDANYNGGFARDD